MSAMTSTPVAPDAAGVISTNLGKRCQKTWLVASSASELRSALTSEVPRVSECLETMNLASFAVGDIKYAKAALRGGGSALSGGSVGDGASGASWLLADNSRVGSFTCPAIMRGADVVIDDLTSLAEAPVNLCALSLSRDVCKDEQTYGALEALVRQWGTSAHEPQLEEYNALCLTRNHNAQAVVADLTCHPAVSAVRYPGLPEDISHPVALRTFEHGFGQWVRFSLAGPQEVQGALEVASGLETGGAARVRSALFSVPGDEASLLLAVGDEDPLAIVMWLEAVLDPA